LQYFKIVNKLKKSWKKIASFKDKYCIYEDFSCKLYNKEAPLLSLTSNDFFDPMYFFKSIKEKCQIIKNIEIIDPNCKRCSYKIKNILTLILKDLINLDLIKEFRNILKEDKGSNKSNNIYKKLLGINDRVFNNGEKAPLIQNLQLKKLIKIYKIGDYGIFDVHIHEIPFEYEKLYSLRFSIERNTQHNYINKLLRDIASNIHILELEQTISLEKLIGIYEAKAIAYINTKYNFDELTSRKIAFLASLQKLNLLKLFPLLIDDNIEEVFLDSPIDRIYINHQNYGRCRTDIILSIDEIERIKTFLRLYSGKRLDYTNPSLKYVLKNKYFYCRFAVDIDPIHSNKFGLDIRKLNKNIYTIQDLLKKESLNPLMAAFLYFCLLRKINLTVTGQTDTGKTTLINALDLIAPKEYRKVYVEDITESLNESEFGRHQVKFKVDSIESMIEKKYSKQNQIKNLLHRTPDIIYLGEILTKEEAEAMFHCLAAGLSGFQTIHSKDLNSLVNRFLHHFNINQSCLDDLDLIIVMKKNRKGRKIISISEISDFSPNSNNFHNILFLFNPKTSKWDLKSDLFKTKTISQLKMMEDLTANNFDDYLSIYQEIFQFLLNSDKLNNQELVGLFDKINHLSFKSYTALNEYWQKWKKYRSLNH
jgi:type IV secretory pathway ATPase VirB11/archaellum biosynthesis ATPase